MFRTGTHLGLIAALAGSPLLASRGLADASPAAPAAAKPLSPEDEARRKQVIARVEGVDITVGRVEDYLKSQAPGLRDRYREPKELKTLVDNMVRFELLAAEAKRRNYDKNPAVVRTVKDGAVQGLLRVDIDDKITPQNVPAEEVKAYYEANAVEFHRAATRRASQILLDTEAEAKALLPEAQKADARAFTELAKQHSKDAETKLRGGDLGYFTLEPVPATPDANIPVPVRAATFALKNVSDTVDKPVAVDGRFAIVRLTGERPERNTTLNDAEPSIRTKLWREKRQKALTQLLDGLRARDKPKVFAEKVDLVKLDDMDKRPSGFAPEPPAAAKKGPGHPDHRPPPAAGEGKPAAPSDTAQP